MTNYWIVMFYNFNNKRTVIGVQNYRDGKPIIIHHTVDSQWHPPTRSPGAIDVGLLQYMLHTNVTHFVHQTVGLEIPVSTLANLDPIELPPVKSGPFKYFRRRCVCAPCELWVPSKTKWVRPFKMSDEITLDETGNAWSVGVDTRFKLYNV